VINTHWFLKYNNNIGALKNLNASVRLIRETRQCVICNTSTGKYELYKHCDIHKIQVRRRCIQHNGNPGRNNHNCHSVFAS
jgi:hypothetical protein